VPKWPEVGDEPQAVEREYLAAFQKDTLIDQRWQLNGWIYRPLVLPHWIRAERFETFPSTVTLDSLFDFATRLTL
jgi:hypothetical protein